MDITNILINAAFVLRALHIITDIIFATLFARLIGKNAKLRAYTFNFCAVGLNPPTRMTYRLSRFISYGIGFIVGAIIVMTLHTFL